MTLRPPGLGGRRSQARAKTREAVVETALRLFSEHGYLGVRVEDIAREAGVSRATFYKYFAEREEILAALMARLFEDGTEAVEDIAAEDSAGDIAERVKSAARQLVSKMLEREQLARFVYSLPVRHEALLGEQQPQMPPALRLVDRLIEQAAAAGELRDDVPTELVCGQVHGTIETTLREWAAGRVPDPHARLDQRLDLIFGGAQATPVRRRR